MDIRKCEVCGQTFIAGYGYSLALNWLVTGSAHVAAYMCGSADGGQHWGCTPSHAIEAVMKCLTEDMTEEKLLEKHEASGKPRYADSDAHWASDKGDNFHHVTISGGSYGNNDDKI